MKRYQPAQPRFALAAAAVVMTASTLGLTIVVPSHLEADARAAVFPVTATSAAESAQERAALRCTDSMARPELSAVRKAA